jgi:hydroxymethylglutaryl-CoA reductase (NADPH)
MANDTTQSAADTRVRVSRDKENDYSNEMAERRRRFVQEHLGATLSHVGHYSIDPASLPGNIENFMGVAQVPIGLAGPLRITGEHANGDSTFRWRPRRARSLPATTAGCVC